MKLAFILFSVLNSLSLCFAAQGTPPVICRGKPLSIRVLPLPGPKVTAVAVFTRFGGTRELPRLQFPSDKPFRQVIKNREEFSDFWKRLTGPISPGSWIPPLPEIDFSKEMLVVSAMGQRPSPGYTTMIDGACEVDGSVEVFVSNVDDVPCSPVPGVLTAPADAVLLPRSDLPVVFRETKIGCAEWPNQPERLNQSGTIYSVLKYQRERRDKCLRFKTGVTSEVQSSCDVLYGSLRTGEEWDWLMTSSHAGSRSVVRDLGLLSWQDDFEVPAITPLPKLLPGQIRSITVDTSGADGAPGAPGKPGANADGSINRRSSQQIEANPPPAKPRNDRKPKIDPIFVKAVAGHMYVVHVVDDKNDFYALFRVDAVERGDHCVISWRVIGHPHPH